MTSSTWRRNGSRRFCVHDENAQFRIRPYWFDYMDDILWELQNWCERANKKKVWPKKKVDFSMKSMWPGRLNIRIPTVRCCDQYIYECKTFFFRQTLGKIKKIDLKKKHERVSPITKWTHYVGRCLGSYRAKKTAKAKWVEVIVTCTKFLRSKVQRQLACITWRWDFKMPVVVQ